MSQQINLVFGHGGLDAFLDLQKLEVYEFVSPRKGNEIDVKAVEELAARYGGKLYYRSHSGLSGAASIPQTLIVRKLATYRVDTVHPQMPYLTSVSEVLPGLKIIVPVDYRQRGISTAWPIIVVKNHSHSRSTQSGFDDNDQWFETTTEWEEYDELVLTNNYGLRNYLLGNSSSLREQKVAIRYIPAPGKEIEEKEYTVKVDYFSHTGKPQVRHVRKAISSLFKSEWEFRLSTSEEKDKRQKVDHFWNRLGLWQIGDLFYKITNGIAWASYSREDLRNPLVLQEVAPINVHVLSPTLYVQDEGRQFIAVCLVTIEGDEIGVPLNIELSEAINAFGGKFKQIEERAIQVVTEELANLREEQTRVLNEDESRWTPMSDAEVAAYLGPTTLTKLQTADAEDDQDIDPYADYEDSSIVDEEDE